MIRPRLRDLNYWNSCPRFRRSVQRWKRTAGQSSNGLESFFVYFLAGVRYVRYALGLQIVLARSALFALFISVIPALMPVLGLRVLHFDPSQLGLLFTSLGAGSVAGASFIIPWLRVRYSSNTLMLGLGEVVEASLRVRCDMRGIADAE